MRLYTIWIRERDKEVWHGMARRLGGARYQAGCGWELSPLSGKVWPLKHDDPGPPHEERCHSCVSAE